jgi:hypothetical protein
MASPRGPANRLAGEGQRASQKGQGRGRLAGLVLGEGQCHGKGSWMALQGSLKWV